MKYPDRLPENQPRPGNDDGFALIVVLGFLLLVASVLTAFTSSARVVNLQSQNTLIETQLRMAARATSRNMIEQYVSLLVTSPTDKAIDFLAPTSCDFGRLKLYLIMQEHSGLIDLNAANSELLKLGFLSLGFDATQSAENAARTERFRSAPTSNPFLPSDETKFKNASFEHVFELYEIGGLDEITPLELMSIFTVHSRRGVLSSTRKSSGIKIEPKSVSASDAIQISSTAPSGVVAINIWFAARHGGLKYYGSVFRMANNVADIQTIEIIDSKVVGAVSLPKHATWSSSNCRSLFDNDTADFFRASFG